MIELVETPDPGARIKVIGAGGDWKQAYKIYSELEQGNVDALPTAT